MMDWMQYIGAICVAAAGCTALNMLVGNRSLGKTFRLLTTAFFLCVVLVPPLSGGIDVPILPTENTPLTGEQMQTMALEQICRQTEEVLLQKVNQTLASHDLEVQRVEICMDNSEGGDISISEITVYVAQENNLHHLWIQEIVSERLGMQVQVKTTP